MDPKVGKNCGYRDYRVTEMVANGCKLVPDTGMITAKIFVTLGVESLTKSLRVQKVQVNLNS